MSDNPISPLSTLWLASLIFQSYFPSAKTFSLPPFVSPPLFITDTEQEPTSSEPDSDEEADLVLSLETETGLLTNQHTKGKGNRIGK